MRTDDNPSALGRKGEREAKTPTFSLPPNTGGLTTGADILRGFAENPQISQM